MEEKIRKESIEDFTARYRKGVDLLMKYLPWLEEKSGEDTAQRCQKGTLPFPVYDSTLLNFVKDAQDTKMLDRNYNYAYSRRGWTGVNDEKNFIAGARLQDMHDLNAILSRYVLEGRTRGAVWSEGVKSCIFCLVIKKMDELLVKWNKEPSAR